MILSVHVLGGGAAAALSPNWPLAVLFSLLSHFVLDAIPHWHYPVYAEKDKKRGGLKELVSLVFHPRLFIRNPIARDMFSAGVDMLLGLAILFWCGSSFRPEITGMIMMGGIIGVIPDFMTLLHILFPGNNFLGKFRAIHGDIHARTRLDDRHFLGIGSQFAIALLIIWMLI